MGKKGGHVWDSKTVRQWDSGTVGHHTRRNHCFFVSHSPDATIGQEREQLTRIGRMVGIGNAYIQTTTWWEYAQDDELAPFSPMGMGRHAERSRGRYASPNPPPPSMVSLTDLDTCEDHPFEISAAGRWSTSPHPLTAISQRGLGVSSLSTGGVVRSTPTKFNRPMAGMLAGDLARRITSGSQPFPVVDSGIAT